MCAFLLLLPFLMPASDPPEDQVGEADSVIEEVTVFRTGAQISRSASVTLAQGRNEIVFSGLSPHLRGQTLRLSGDGDFMILSISNRRDYLSEHPQEERLEQLKARRDSLSRLIAEQKTAKGILDREVNILLSNTNLKGNQQNLSANELKQAMDYFHQKLSELENGKLELDREIEQLRQEHEKVAKQISELDSSSQRNSSVITAVLRSDSRQRVTLRLSYLVSNAGWNPSYDVRVDDLENPLGLSYKAEVHQSTGVDWKDVTLAVSSAIPDRDGSLPELRPWYIRFFTPSQPGAAMESGMKARQEQEDGMLNEVVRTVPVQQIQNQTSFSYRIDLPYDVPSGGKPLTVEINREEVPAEYRYYTVPKRSGKAYLTAKISDWDQYDLLPGMANLFFEDTFVGQSRVDPRSVGDTLSFSLGRDESVVTERVKLKEFEEKNFFGNKVRQSFAWEISVRNSKGRAIRIDVKDQIPVSRHEDIEVSLEESSGASYDRQTGMLEWGLRVEAGETEKVRFEYEVEYPRGREVRF